MTKPPILKQNEAAAKHGRESQLNSPGINLKRLCSAELFSGARELVIEHAGDEYRLRQTNQGKLILTK
jgi:hemin uptake protein HemP